MQSSLPTSLVSGFTHRLSLSTGDLMVLRPLIRQCRMYMALTASVLTGVYFTKVPTHDP